MSLTPGTRSASESMNTRASISANGSVIFLVAASFSAFLSCLFVEFAPILSVSVHRCQQAIVDLASKQEAIFIRVDPRKGLLLTQFFFVKGLLFVCPHVATVFLSHYQGLIKGPLQAILCVMSHASSSFRNPFSLSQLVVDATRLALIMGIKL